MARRDISQCLGETSVKADLSNFCSPFPLWAQIGSWTGGQIWVAETPTLRSVPATEVLLLG